MSSDILSRILTLHKKADELAHKGHVLRAAENYGRAADAARSLGADNLIMLHMQLYQASSLAVYVAEAKANTKIQADPDMVAAHCKACITLSFDAVEALERRRVASTLVEGRCDAVEELWFYETCQLGIEKPNTPAASVGYQTFVQAARDVLILLCRARGCFAGCADVQLQSFVRHVVHAGEWMQQPRHNNTGPLQAESAFAEVFDTVVDVLLTRSKPLDAALVQLLVEGWVQLKGSGVLQARSIVGNPWYKPIGVEELFSAVLEKSMSDPGLRCCALASCGIKEAHPQHFKSCAACRGPVYCCKEHQTADWPRHKAECKAARKATAEAAAA